MAAVKENEKMAGKTAGLDEAVSGQLTPLRNSLQNPYDSVGGGFFDAVKAMSLQFMADGTARSVDDAAKLATDLMVNRNYTFVERNGAQTRIPIEHARNAGVIEDGIDAVLAMMQGRDAVIVPGEHGMTPSAVQAMRDELVSTAKAITASGDEGVTFTWADRSVMQLRDGTPAHYTFDELIDIGSKARGGYATDRLSDARDRAYQVITGAEPSVDVFQQQREAMKKRASEREIRKMQMEDAYKNGTIEQFMKANK